jgi:acyl-coenzyme A synthetase/AMP-(fatty) acid ligase/acyl carrier protein
MSESFDNFFNSTSSKLALKSPTISISYGDLGPISDRLANVLLAKDIGDTFFYLGRPGVLAHIYFLACLKAGKGFLLINKKLSPTNILAIVSELGDEHMIFTDRETDITSYTGLKFETLPELSAIKRKFNEARIKVAMPSDQVVLYNTTSGSTGIPKIVPLTFSDLTENIRLTELAWDFGPDDIVGNPGEFCAEHMIVTFKRGSTMSFSNVSDQSAQVTREWLDHDKVSILICYVAIFRVFRYIEGQFKSLKQIGTYGDVTLSSDIELFNRMCLPGAQYHSFLGLQEILYVMCNTWSQGTAPTKGPFSLGKPVLEDSLFLADEHGQPVPVGQTGEIVIRTPLLSNFINGYAGGRKGSGRLIKENDLTIGFGIGDLAIQDEDGSFYFMGRSDDQVKISGFNVRLLEVEQAVQAIGTVSDAAVTVQGARRENRILCCHYVGDVTPLALRELLKAHLPEFMIPHHCVQIIELPRTATGKVDKLGLDMMLDEEIEFGSKEGLANNLRALWCELLGHSEFRIDSNFLNVGGDSLALIKMSLAIEEQTGLQIVFESFEQAGMSISGLVKLIEEERQNTDGGQAGMIADQTLTSLTTKEKPAPDSMLLLNRKILERWDAKPAGQSKYFVCERPDESKTPVVWIFQTEVEYQSLTNAVGDAYCVYGARSMSSFTRFFENGPNDDMAYYTAEHVSHMASVYVSEILALVGSRRFILGGNCQAGIISLCMADALLQANITIDRLIILNAVEDRQDYKLPATLLFGAAEFEDFNKQPKGIQAFPAAIVRQIDGDHGQYFLPYYIGPIVTAIHESCF